MIILLGSTGYVGQVFQKQLTERSVEWEPLSGRQFTFANKAALVEALESKKASFLVNCAGYTGKPNVDACELDKGNCLDGNAILPSVIREVCVELGIGWGMFLAAAFSPVNVLVEVAGGKTMLRISLSANRLARSTVEPRLWARKC